MVEMHTDASDSYARTRSATKPSRSALRMRARSLCPSSHIMAAGACADDVDVRSAELRYRLDARTRLYRAAAGDGLSLPYCALVP